tara:strand:+ start:212 stop:379 length:168 start_codon:yes stop_codon:yes gene_type:complete
MRVHSSGYDAYANVQALNRATSKVITESMERQEKAARAFIPRPVSASGGILNILI